ncbi:hypothetical protein PLESTB_000133800 [Pleodorina starrii]|uniref:3'-5' exonuclease domain-containing protein n=1 Tax=Pleodorina starrii TaxID=330485 RepID=A0A9W6BBJ9_9CHLO|nr:hypothetical protein PLESTM_002077700 [Pleodorina starrii]GLC48760.1 hypothetical protein PLESTB_000133800 [Pleodorina starrii]
MAHHHLLLPSLSSFPPAPRPAHPQSSQPKPQPSPASASAAAATGLLAARLPAAAAATTGAPFRPPPLMQRPGGVHCRRSVAGSAGDWAATSSSSSAAAATAVVTEDRPSPSTADDSYCSELEVESGSRGGSGAGTTPNGGAAAAAAAAPPPLLPRLTSSDVRAYVAAHGMRAEVVPELSPSQQQQLPPGHGIIKSIVLMVGPGEAPPPSQSLSLSLSQSQSQSLSPLLVVVRLEDRVDERRVAELMQVARRRVRLARPEEVLAHTGFVVGSVPPFGHHRRLRTLVDTAVTRLTHVYGGGGDPDMELSVAVPDLLSYANASVASVAVAAPAPTPSPPTPTTPTSLLPQPWPPGSVSVELVAVIVQRRRIARLLQFVNLVPEQGLPSLPPDGQAVYLRRLWSDPDSGSPVEVQLIMGKTLERNLGREAARALMDQVKVGSIVALTGRVQPHPPSRAPSATATAPATTASIPASAPAPAGGGGGGGRDGGTGRQPAPSRTLAIEPSATGTQGAPPTPITLPTPPSTSTSASMSEAPPAAPGPSQRRQRQQRQQQQRPDVLDVVCHSLTVLHKDTDVLRKALRAAKRAGLGSPSTAQELLRLQQLRLERQEQGKEEKVVSETVSEPSAAPKVGSGISKAEDGGGGGGGGGGLPSDTAAGREVEKEGGLGKEGEDESEDEDESEVMGGDGGLAVLGRRRRHGPQATHVRPAGRSGVARAAQRSGGDGGAAQGLGATGPGGAAAAGGSGGGGDEAASLAAAAAAATGWRMPLPPSAVRLVRSAAELAEVEREVLGLVSEGAHGVMPAATAADGCGDGGAVPAVPAAAAAAAASVGRVVALDCEWAPFDRHRPKTPVSILQLATRERVYILDLFALLTPTAPPPPHLQQQQQPQPQPQPQPPPAESVARVANGNGNGIGAAGGPTAAAAAESSVACLPEDGPRLFSRFLSRLMSSSGVVKLGFQLASDLDRLCESYPYLPCFSEETRAAPACTESAASERGAGSATASSSSNGHSNGHSNGQGGSSNSCNGNGDAASSSANTGAGAVATPATAPGSGSGSGSGFCCRQCVDLVALARGLRPDLARTPQISLSRLMALVLGEPLDKTQQLSDWARRPLTAEQVLYAATDAYCLVALYDALLGLSGGENPDGEGEPEGAAAERLQRAARILQVVGTSVKRLPRAAPATTDFAA